MQYLARAATAAVRITTPLGGALLAIATLAWSAVLLLGWEEFGIIAVTAVVALLLAVLFTVGRNRYEIELDLQPERVMVGDVAGGQMLVRNLGGSRSLPVRVELTIGDAAATYRVPSLAHLAAHDELFTIPTVRRAVIPVGPASTVRGDPIGLMRREHEWAAGTTLYVHPRVANLDRLGSGFLRDLEGQTTQDLSPSDVAFHTLREYVPGDDLRHIHWKTTARVGDLMVRQFVDTRRSFLAVVVPTDAAAYASDDEFELAVSMGASIGVRALRDEQTVSFIAGDRTLASSNAVRLLDSCAGIDPSDESGALSACIAQANRVAAEASIIAVAVGSAMTVAQIRRSVARLKSDARVLVFRADLDGERALQTIMEMTLVNASSLDEYAQLLHQASLS